MTHSLRIGCDDPNCIHKPKARARGSDDDRRQIIADLISDPDSPFKPDSQPGLELMPDDTLRSMRDQYLGKRAKPKAAIRVHNQDDERSRLVADLMHIAAHAGGEANLRKLPLHGLRQLHLHHFGEGGSPASIVCRAGDAEVAAMTNGYRLQDAALQQHDRDFLGKLGLRVNEDTGTTRPRINAQLRAIGGVMSAEEAVAMSPGYCLPYATGKARFASRASDPGHDLSVCASGDDPVVHAMTSAGPEALAKMRADYQERRKSRR